MRQVDPLGHPGTVCEFRPSVHDKSPVQRTRLIDNVTAAVNGVNTLFDVPIQEDMSASNRFVRLFPLS